MFLLNPANLTKIVFNTHLQNSSDFCICSALERCSQEIFCDIEPWTSKPALFSPPFHVLHYGPKEGSVNKTDVISYIHQLPDETWQEPSPEDPLSLIDQVNLVCAVICSIPHPTWRYPIPIYLYHHSPWCYIHLRWLYLDIKEGITTHTTNISIEWFWRTKKNEEDLFCGL